MFRLRRYRVFLVFTAVVIGSLYYLATTRHLESPGASVQGLKNLSLKEKFTTQQPNTIKNHFYEDKQDASISSTTIALAPTIPADLSPSRQQLSPTTKIVGVDGNSKLNPMQTDKQPIKDKPAISADLNRVAYDDLKSHEFEEPATPSLSPEPDEAPLELSRNGKFEKHAPTPTSQRLQLASADYSKYVKPDKTAATTMSKSILKSILEPSGKVRSDSVTDVPISTIHWNKQAEHFPVPSQSIISLPSGKPSAIPKIQHAFSDESVNDRINRLQKLEDIKAAFLASWNGYKNKAWTQDELTPVSGSYRNPFCGWAATLVDSLDTLWIMGLKEEFEEATNAVKNIDFTISNRPDLPLFEVVIRYLGGLIAAYDLSSGTYRVLLEKAEELAEVLMGAFDTPNRMPMTKYFWKPAFASQPHRALTRVVLAELGSLSVEFTRLSQLTRKSKYYDAIARITDELESWQNNTKVPGLWPKKVDASGCKKPDMTLISQNNHSLLSGPTTENAGHSIDLPSSKVGKLSADHSAKYDQVSLEESLEDDANYTQELISSKEVQARIGHAIDDPTDESGPGVPTAYTKELSSSENERVKSNHSAVYGQPLDKEKGRNLNSHAGRGLNLNSREANFANTQTESDVRPKPNSGLIKRQFQDKVIEPTSTILAKTAIDVVETSTPTTSGIIEGMPDCEPQGLASPPGDGYDEFTLGGQADSAYEYLPKQYMLLGGLEEKYQRMYEMAIEASKKYLFFRPMLPDDRDILLSGSVTIRAKSYEDKLLLHPEGSHLTCFAGGMLAIGAKIFDRNTDLDLARKLTDGCVWAYEATTTGIMPEHYLAVPCMNGIQCKWNETRYEELIDSQRKQRAEQQKPILQRPQQLEKDSMAERGKPPSEGAKFHHTSQGAHSTDEVEAVPTAHEDLREDSSSKLKSPTKRQLRDVEDEIPLKQEAKVTEAGKPQTSPETDVPKYNYESEKGKSQLKETGSGDDDKAAPVVVEQREANVTVIATKSSSIAPTAEGPHPSKLPPGMTQISSTKYILRPEAIESIFIMYRITGNTYWREKGWEMFESIMKHTSAKYGASAIDDVTSDKPLHTDSMESFWLAETLKYFYLLFSDPEVISLDDYVLNTEAHPFKRPK